MKVQALSSPGQRKLNVVLVTYNHSLYIKQCIDGILMQKTNFKFNVIVADDKSTDGNLDIIKKQFEGSDIDVIYLEDEKNLGLHKNYIRAYQKCDAEYVAFLEGDDFWTNPYRLQKHVDFLDNHHECTMTCNRYVLADYDKGRFAISDAHAPDFKSGFFYMNCESIIAKGGPNITTCVYRKSILDILRDDYFDNHLFSDWTLHIMASMHGVTAFLTEVMSVYRMHAASVWSGLSLEERHIKLIELIDQMNAYTDKKYNDEFEAKKQVEIILLAQDSQKFKLLAQGSSKFKGHFFKRVVKSCINAVWMLTPPILVWVLKAILPHAISDVLKKAKDKSMK